MEKSSSPLWQGRSSGSVDDIMIDMGESISLDIHLYREDIAGSRAHARMLEKIGILSEEDLKSILEGLDQVELEIRQGRLPLRPELEDIHTHVETRLVELVGEAGKRLHTARSRNDQVALDTHLFVQRTSREILEKITLLLSALLKRAEENVEAILPGYTHLQVAQPIRLSHHLMAHFWAFLLDAERFLQALEGARRLPLGSGALAGVNYPNDREFLKAELGFSSLYENSMDAVASRDHMLDYLHAASVFAAHASRLAEEIVLWNSVELAFITLPDSLTTGSSIMPQKKNPDLAELIRGKTGRIYGHHLNLLTTLKGLPYAYNRDLQEDRFPLIDTGEQVQLILRALHSMVNAMQFNSQNMTRSLEKGFATATDLADALVNQKGIPFRESHHIAGSLVALCVKENHTLSSIPAKLRATIHPALADDTFYSGAIDMMASTEKKVSRGGTSRVRQTEQLETAKKAIAELQSQIPPEFSITRKP